MPLIQVKLIEGVFTAPQKQEIIERLTDAMVAIEGWHAAGSPPADTGRRALLLRGRPRLTPP